MACQETNYFCNEGCGWLESTYMAIHYSNKMSDFASCDTRNFCDVSDSNHKTISFKDFNGDLDENITDRL